MNEATAKLEALQGARNERLEAAAASEAAAAAAHAALADLRTEGRELTKAGKRAEDRKNEATRRLRVAADTLEKERRTSAAMEAANDATRAATAEVEAQAAVLAKRRAAVAAEVEVARAAADDAEADRAKAEAEKAGLKQRLANLIDRDIGHEVSVPKEAREKERKKERKKEREKKKKNDDDDTHGSLFGNSLKKVVENLRTHMESNTTYCQLRVVFFSPPGQSAAPRPPLGGFPLTPPSALTHNRCGSGSSSKSRPTGWRPR